jgi:hypothetical protein
MHLSGPNRCGPTATSTCQAGRDPRYIRSPPKGYADLDGRGLASAKEVVMDNNSGMKELVVAIIAAIIAFFSISSFFGFVASID